MASAGGTLRADGDAPPDIIEYPNARGVTIAVSVQPPPASSNPIDLSMVIPMYNAEDTIREAVSSLLAQEDFRPKEIIVVDDGSTDQSLHIVQSLAKGDPRIVILEQDHAGAARAVNRGIYHASGDLVGLLDSDAEVSSTWASILIPEFDDVGVGAAAGAIKLANPTSFWARAAGYEVDYRLSKTNGDRVDHLSTCNVVYRKSVLDGIGLFDTDMRIGYDVDMSYRIGRAGFRMVLNRDAICRNYWREDFWPFLRQQYRYAFDRLELATRYSGRMRGDDVVGVRMLAQVPLTFVLVASLTLASWMTLAAGNVAWFWLPGIVFAGMLAERLQEAFAISRRFNDKSMLLLPLVHTVRNFAWFTAACVWIGTRIRSLAKWPKQGQNKKGGLDAKTQ